MTTTFIGIDLAWKSKRNPSGVAILKGDRGGAHLIKAETMRPGESVADFVTANTSPSTVIAVDAPLLITNQTGQRACETAVGKRYGARDASCHTSNLDLYNDAPGVQLTKTLLAQGFQHPIPNSKIQPDRIVMEVYPHAAMVALWDLAKIIKYKKGSIATRRNGLDNLRTQLRKLSNAEPRILNTGVLMELFTTKLNGLTGHKLKLHEDQLDALFCAYLAYYFWYWGWDRCELFGDTASGYILNPKLSSAEAIPTIATQLADQMLAHASPDLKVPSHVGPGVIELETLNLQPETGSSQSGSYGPLIAQASELARPYRPSVDCTAASVASVIVSRSGKTYTGVCLDFSCSLGFCAEHAAIAEMLKAHESEIALVVAVDETGKVLAPCGRCREMMWQLNPANKDALVILAPDRARPLHELLPER